MIVRLTAGSMALLAFSAAIFAGICIAGVVVTLAAVGVIAVWGL